MKTSVFSERTSCQKKHPRKCRWQEGNFWRGSSCAYQHEHSDFNTKKRPTSINFDDENVNVEIREDVKADDTDRDKSKI